MATRFDNHEIVSRVEADGFGSWLLMRRHEDGGWDNTFWVRITAADRRLTVVGDFEPTVFAHGPLDPLACLRWIGSRGEVDGYRAEKAEIGTGHGRIWTYDPEQAKRELQEMLRNAEVAALVDDEIDALLIEDDDYGAKYREALQAGLDAKPRDGILGADDIISAVMMVDSDMHEVVVDIGRKLRPSVELAVQAAHRLTLLLETEAQVLR